MSARLTGVCVSQEDDPWWLVAVLGWIAMYTAIMGSTWEKAEGYRQELKARLEREPPSLLYAFYKDFNTFYEADMREQQAKARRGK